MGAAALLVLSHALAEEPQQAPSEYQVKAAFLYNFAKFVEWPALANPAFPITMCVLGKDPFGKALESVMEGKTVNGRPIVIRRTNDLAVARSCQVLFLSASEAGRAGEIVKGLRDASVLTVSDLDRFTEAGGVIALVMEGQRVRFRINSKAAAFANLKISSKLLQLALPAPEDKEKD